MKGNKKGILHSVNGDDKVENVFDGIKNILESL